MLFVGHKCILYWWSGGICKFECSCSSALVEGWLVKFLFNFQDDYN